MVSECIQRKRGHCELHQRHSHTFTVWSTLPVTTYGAVLWKSARRQKLTLPTNPELQHFLLSLNGTAFSKQIYQLKGYIPKLLAVLLQPNSLRLLPRSGNTKQKCPRIQSNSFLTVVHMLLFFLLDKHGHSEPSPGACRHWWQVPELPVS